MSLPHFIRLFSQQPPLSTAKNSRNSAFSKPSVLAVLIGLVISVLSTHAYANGEEKPMEVKVVVVSMFEIGDDEGDAPGEFQLWKARQKLTTKYPLPHGFHDVYANTETGVMQEPPLTR